MNDQITPQMAEAQATLDALHAEELLKKAEKKDQTFVQTHEDVGTETPETKVN